MITLEKVYEECRTNEKMRGLDGRLRMIDDRTIKLSSTLKELHDLLKKHCKSSFVIKGSAFEVRISLSWEVVMLSLFLYIYIGTA